jgi:hypothetical protein
LKIKHSIQQQRPEKKSEIVTNTFLKFVNTCYLEFREVKTWYLEF